MIAVTDAVMMDTPASLETQVLLALHLSLCFHDDF